MSGYKVIPPDLDSCKSYDVYLKRLQVWEATTPAPASKRGPIIASSLPNDSQRYKKDLQDKFFEWVDCTRLCGDTGLDLVKEFLAKELSEEDLERSVRLWDEFEECKRDKQEIGEFLSDFERRYNKVVIASKTAKIPSELLAFMALKRSGATSTQRLLVLSRLDYTNKDKLFENMCRELKLILGGGPGNSSCSTDAITLEPVAGEEGVYVTNCAQKFYKQNLYRGRGGSSKMFRNKQWEKPSIPRENRKDENG